jgi:uncharacterized protein YcbX
MYHVDAIHIYPVKSLGGMALDAADATPIGFAWDRRWMLVDAAGTFVSQRGHPSLARLSARLEPRADGGVPDLVITRQPDGETLVIVTAGVAAERIAVDVWGDSVLALPVSSEADHWFSTFIEKPVRLVFFPDDAARSCDPEWAAPGDKVAFADGFPYLVTTTGALAAVAAEVGTSLEMLRFRPNLVIAADEPFAEDDWRRIAVGGLPMRLVKPCGRCVMVNVDPATGRSGREPLRSLTRTRRFGSRVVFGQNAVFDGSGRIRVGDSVVVLERASDAPF